MLALVTALGGGTVRDLCLGNRPVFWVTAPDYLVISLVTAIGTFILARQFKFPERTLGLADAFGLALFGIIGTEKALHLQTPVSVAIFMGVITGVASFGMCYAMSCHWSSVPKSISIPPPSLVEPAFLFY